MVTKSNIIHARSWGGRRPSFLSRIERTYVHILHCRVQPPPSPPRALYGLTTTAMHDMSTHTPALPSPVQRKACSRISLERSAVYVQYEYYSTSRRRVFVCFPSHLLFNVLVFSLLQLLHIPSFFVTQKSGVTYDTLVQ